MKFFFFSFTSTVMLIIWSFLIRLPPTALLLLVPCSSPASFDSSHSFQDEVQILAVLTRQFLLWFLPPFLALFPAFPSIYLYLSHHKLVKNSLNLSLRITVFLLSSFDLIISKIWLSLTYCDQPSLMMPVQPILLCLCSHKPLCYRALLFHLILIILI